MSCTSRTSGSALRLTLMFAAAVIPAACNRTPSSPATSALAGCLPGERGFLRASLRGALNADLDWHGSSLQCEGSARPDGEGIRLSFAGPLSDGRHLRLVLGVAVKPGVSTSASLPTNLTLIVENGGKLFATLGDDKCTVESLVQQPLPTSNAPSAARGDYRVAARGFCVDPASTLDGSERLFINRFDLAGRAHFEDNERHVPQPSNAGA